MLIPLINWYLRKELIREKHKRKITHGKNNKTLASKKNTGVDQRSPIKVATFSGKRREKIPPQLLTNRGLRKLFNLCANKSSVSATNKTGRKLGYLLLKTN